MARLLLSLFLALLSGTVLAQESDYYRIPSKRETLDGIVALPHLKPQQNFWYLDLRPGYRTLKTKLVTDGYQGLINETRGNLYLEANLGFNKTDLWDLGLSYQNMPTLIGYRALSNSGQNLPGYFSSKFQDHIVGLQYSRRVFYLDKIQKKTRLNLMAGVAFSLNQKDQTLDQTRFRLVERQIGSPATDTLSISSLTIMNAKIPSFYGGIEIIGRLAPMIEIGVYSKLNIGQNRFIESDFTFDRINGAGYQNSIYTTGYGWRFGLILRWNVLHSVSYIEKL